MQTYAQYSPTGFDARGAFLPERQTWFVAPVMRTRDSGTLEESNFAACLKQLGGESETVEVHRFGHWGPGWFEIILVSPERAAEVEEIEASLADYPVLDETDYSRREYEAACTWWEQMGLHERIRVCTKFRTSIFAARRADEIPERVEISYLADGY